MSIWNRSNYSLKYLSDVFYSKETEEIESNFSRDQLFKKFYEFEKLELKNTIKNFEDMLNDDTDIVLLEKDMIRCKYALKATFNEYFMLDFINKNDDERTWYITNWYRHRYFNFLNELFYQKFYSDKYKTYKKYKKFYKREMILIKNSSDFDIFKNFINKHSIVIKKPYNRSLGIWIEIIKKSAINKHLFKKYLKESWKFVLEELIQQSDEMAILHPESVNTVRIYGYIDDNNNIITCFPFIKMWVWNSIVDNGWAGGIIAAVDSSGVVTTDWIDELWNKYKVHPDTKIKIKGFKLPDWNTAINIVKSASWMNKYTRLIWRDLAYTKEGWVIVEWNWKWHFLWQIAMQKWMKNDFEKMIHRDSVENKQQYVFWSRK